MIYVPVAVYKKGDWLSSMWSDLETSFRLDIGERKSWGWDMIMFGSNKNTTIFDGATCPHLHFSDQPHLII